MPEDLWKVGKLFLAGFRRHYWYLLLNVFVDPFELYEKVIRPSFLSEAWPEHLIVPSSAFPWILCATLLWTAFLTYRDLYREKMQIEREAVTIMLDKQWRRKGGREYTPAPLDVLRSYYNKHTSAEGDRLVAPHIGKWIRADGIVKDASNLPVGDGKKGCISLQEREPHIKTLLLFSAYWNDRIEMSRTGEHIFYEGKSRQSTTIQSR